MKRERAVIMKWREEIAVLGRGYLGRGRRCRR